MNKVDLPTCCMDMDIELMDLIFPERLNRDGYEFIVAHGILQEKLEDLIKGAVVMSSTKVKIKHRCNQLLDNGLCKIYDNRPNICKCFDCSTRIDCACHGKGRINE